MPKNPEHDQEDALLYVRLAPEWDAAPLWIETTKSDTVRPVYADDFSEEFPISPPLVHDIEVWDREYQDLFDRTDPGASGFPSEQTEAQWSERGKQIAIALHHELGDDVTLEYRESFNTEFVYRRPT